MAFSGYARVSTSDQDLKIQKLGLRTAGCDVIRAETATGTSLTELVRKSSLVEKARQEKELSTDW